MSNGTLVNLQPITFKQQNVAAMDHYFATGVMDYDKGNMDRFDQNPTGNGQTAGAFAYSYLDRTDVAPYWTMAQRYVLADKMFPTMFGPSFTGHLLLIAGTADISPTLSEVDLPNGLPWGCDAPAGTISQLINTSRSKQRGPFPCFSQFKTMADTLNPAGITWHYYAPSVADLGGKEWSSFDAISNVYHSTYWKARVTSPPQQILTDVANGTLAGVTWVVPDYAWSDHPNAETPYGPSWVSAIVNAIGQSKFWQTTAIVVVWDDWGGFFDDAPPPQLDFRGLGIRVPCLIISPYVTAHVSHTTYEFGSILRFVEQTFNLPELGSASAGYTDARANSIIDSFNFTQSPRAFKVIPAPYPPTFFAKRAPSLRAPDDE
jgi:phospholipase C